MMLKALFVGAMFVLPMPVLAQGAARVDAETGSFAEQRAKIEADLADGETYTEISMEHRSEVMKGLNTIEAVLRGRPVSELGGAEKNEVMHAQALINNRLTQAGEDSRMVCRREARAGTRLPRSQCLTVAQRRRAREEAQDSLSRNRMQNENFTGF